MVVCGLSFIFILLLLDIICFVNDVKDFSKKLYGVQSWIRLFPRNQNNVVPIAILFLELTCECDCLSDILFGHGSWRFGHCRPMAVVGLSSIYFWLLIARVFLY